MKLMALEVVLLLLPHRMVAALSGLLLLSFSTSAAEIPEYKLKAAYLYNFAVFTEWEEASMRDPFQLCIFGEDPFRDKIKRVTSRTIHDRSVKARTVKTLEGLAGCQMVFIAPSANKRISQVVAHLERQPVLMVADQKGALNHGVMVNMMTRRGKVQFDINLKAVKKSGLSMSAKLLRLARKVIR